MSGAIMSRTLFKTDHKIPCRGTSFIPLGFLALIMVSLASAAPPPTYVIATGQEASARLKQGLKKELIHALEKGDFTEAVSVCAYKAQSLTAQISATLPKGVRVKRISSRYRNPANRPDSRGAQVLAFYEALAKEGAPLPPHRIQEENGSYRYYEPIRVGALCLKCHGGPGVLAPEVRPILEELYPGDKAVGYNRGDFRGLIQVTIPAQKQGGP